MTFPLQITYRHGDRSVALDERIRELAARLERFSSSIVRCHIIVDSPSGHQQQGGQYDFHIDLHLPGQEIVVRRAHAADQAHADPYVALRNAFRAMRRKLENYERTRRGDVKSHSGSAASIRKATRPD